MKTPIKPIADIDRAWRFASVRLAAAAACFGLLPPDQQAAVLEFLRIPPERLPLVLAIGFMLSRVFKKAE